MEPVKHVIGRNEKVERGIDILRFRPQAAVVMPDPFKQVPRGFESRKSFEITWLVFILFNTLNIPGFLIKDLFIFRQMSLVQALHHEWTAFMPLVFSILFWLLVRLINRASPKQYSTRSHYEQNQ